ncbi:MAG: toll/interleukin-1 receptor domain-containing protein [Nitrospira sp.]|nr:toll/interleukin-1 receptor domain-containing protein [Nitrospira sp.]
MPSIFLSYSRTDLSLIEQLERHLKSSPEISIWRDQDKLYGGQKWPKILGEAIAQQDVFLLAWSKHSATSHFVEFEWTTAIALKKTIIPCLLDSTPLPVALRATHAITAYNPDEAAGHIFHALKAPPPAQDQARKTAVIQELATIRVREEAAVIQEVRSIFAAQQWTIQGNVYQAGGDIHIHHPPSRNESQKPLVEKWGMWVSLVAGIVSIITPFLSYIPFISESKVVEVPAPPSSRDPLSTTLHENKSKDSPDDGLGSLVNKITTYLGSGQKLSTLIVMTAEDVEVRIADRRAVEAALNVACFSRENSPDLTTYFKFLLNRGASATPMTGVIPYEWYARDKISLCRASEYNIEHLLILWIKASDYQGQTLAGIHRLLEMIHPANHQRLNVKIIGPHNSSEFLSILKEIESKVVNALKSQSNGSRSILNYGKMELYSPWVTAMPGLLSYGLKDPDGHLCDSYAACDKVFYQLLEAGGLDLVHAINNDAVLVDALLMELQRRRVTVGNHSIALISNWDSIYAKSLRLTFSEAVCNNSYRWWGSNLGGSESCLNWLQGLHPLKKTGISPEDFVTHHSYTSANAEYDKEALISNIKRSKPRAIGILGTAPKDTLLILQVLKKEFPGVLFFTTNLDFEYLQNSEQKQSRNLIVVSQFGLELAPSLQQSIPAFRSSLQTSTFFAVLHAIDQVRVEPSKNKLELRGSGKAVVNTYASEIPPRIFEIGRHGAVNLSFDQPSTEGNTIHPARTDVDRIGGLNLPPRIALLWIVGLNLALLVSWKYRGLWNWLMARDEPGSAKRLLTMVLRSALVYIPILWAQQIFARFNYAEDEPFSWSDGVSIWPTILLRLVACALCAYFFVLYRLELDHNLHELSTRFFSAGSIRETKKRWPEGWARFCQSIDWIGPGLPSGHATGAADLWERYREAHSWNHRAGRVILWYFIYLVTFGLAFIFFADEVDLFVPCRGDFSCSTNYFVGSISVLFLVFLSFTVMDSVWLCISWLNELSDTTELSAKAALALGSEQTRVVKRTIYYPLIVGMMLVGSRSEYFDNWYTTPIMFGSFFLIGLILVASGFVLHMAEIKAGRELMAGKRSEGPWTPQRL